MEDTIFGISRESIDNYLELFAHDKQANILKEECAELIVALSKFERNPTHVTKSGIIEEMSHVLISCAVVSNIYDITQTDISNEVAKKDAKYSELPTT